MKFPTIVVLIGGIVVILSSITINVGANVMAPARAFENLWPRRITFAGGAILTGLLSLLMQPWYVLSTFATYVFTWLGTYGTLLGPFDGIAIADYWLVRELRLDLFQLYSHDGRYDYARGWNLRAIGALVVGWIPPLIGLWNISRRPRPPSHRSAFCGKAAGCSASSSPRSPTHGSCAATAPASPRPEYEAITEAQTEAAPQAATAAEGAPA